MHRPPARRRRSTAALALAALATSLLFAGGCASVKPWQRGRLSHPCMQLQARLGDAYRPHVLSIREGASGGENAIGGGCGCN